MWKLIKITQRPYLMKCMFGADNNVTLILYDHQECWCETLTLDELKRKAKLLNRRYDFSEKDVRDALGGGDLELATLQPDVERGGKLLLQLQYRVKNSPFRFEWLLKKQTVAEFQTLFVSPLCSAVMGCHEQIEILTETLRKKDAEILQYRTEGAILGRKTLATKLFDFDEFAKKYEDNNNVAVDFSEMSKLLQSMKTTKEINPPTKTEQIKQQESPKTKESDLKNPIATVSSPGQRKRKIQELKQKHLERNLKTRKQTITYESSQSQDTTSGSSQSTEVKCETKAMSPQKKLETETKSPQKKLEVKLENVKSKADQLKKQDLNSSNRNVEDTPKLSTSRQLTFSSPQKVEKTDTSPQKDKDSKATTKITSEIKETSCAPKKSPGKSSPLIAAKALKKDLIEINSDSEHSDDIILTPSKLTQMRRAMGRPRVVVQSDTESESGNNLKKSKNEKVKEKDNGRKTQNPIKSPALNTVVEISTDSDDSEITKNSEHRYPKRRNTTTTPTKIKSRVTRSSHQPETVDESNVPRRRNSIAEEAENFQIFETPSKSSKAAASTPNNLIVGEISSQLDAIRKELQSLEALRLADLEQRTC